MANKEERTRVALRVTSIHAWRVELIHASMVSVHLDMPNWLRPRSKRNRVIVLVIGMDRENATSKLSDSRRQFDIGGRVGNNTHLYDSPGMLHCPWRTMATEEPCGPPKGFQRIGKITWLTVNHVA